MARRPDTESDESSRNIDEMPVSSREPKLRASRRNLKQDRRARVEESASQPRGADSDEEEEEEEEEEEAEEDEVDQVTDSDDEGDEGEGSPKGSKRARLTSNEDGSVSHPTRKAKAKARATVGLLPRDDDGYLPGSIVRVKLHQFLTYDDVEFRPGPYLNMVLGPNGSGKSSIACALCLGLNWSPTVLGRAENLGSFVKLGYAEGSIEIELKGRRGQPNLVIQRYIRTSDLRTHVFTLNGVKVKGSKITEQVEALGIQVNNLCSFLPQDKVSEFAQMSPQTLLKATEKAAGNENLFKWHEILIAEGRKLKTINAEISSERSHLETQEQRNAALERDVQAYMERKEIERQIDFLDLLLPFREYLDSREEYDRLKTLRETLHEKAMRLQRRNEPVTKLKEQLTEQFEKCSVEHKRSKDAASAAVEAMKRKWNANEHLSREHEELSDQLSGLKNKEKSRKERIAAFTKQIQQTQAEIDNPPAMEDEAQIDADNRAIGERLVRARAEKEDLQTQIESFLEEEARQNGKIRNAQVELRNLENVAHQKLQALERFDRDTAQVVRWLRENKNRFKMEVCEPAILTLSVKDQRYCEAVEGCISINQLKTFVFQCEEDYKLFNSLIIDNDQELRRKVRIFTWFRPYRAELIMPPPMEPQEMRTIGFDCYALDLVEYPEGLKTFLTLECQMHRTAITLHSDKVDTKTAMDAVSRILPNGKGGSGSFITGRQMNQVTRSRYGRRLPVNVIRDLRTPNLLRFHPVDQERKRHFENEINQAEVLKAAALEEIEKIHQKIRVVEAGMGEIERERTAVTARRNALLELRRRIANLTTKLAHLHDKLRKEQNAPPMEEVRQGLRTKLFDVAKKKATLVKDMQKLVRKVIRDNIQSTKSRLMQLQVGANKAALEVLVNNHDQEYARAQEEYETINREFLQVKNITKKKLNISRSKLDALSDELRMNFEKLTSGDGIKTRDVDSIRQELADLRAKLELNMATNPGVVEQYEKRQRQIESLRNALEDKEAKRATCDNKLRKTRDKWYPALRALVEEVNKNFSDSFERVHCAGEIKIGEAGDDYDNWTIDIMVKFRNTESLQLLTGQRQSGGERALSTIMYLMSLTELTRTPFSLVDEINQGMDARYERAVHNSLVEVTCRPDSGQYFLITPKLLTDLKYDDRMKVLCVSNGEWLPENDTSGNMMGMIDRYLAKSRGRAH